MIAVLFATAAFAWEWDEAEAPTGDGMTIHLCLGDFTDAEARKLFDGAHAWQAGTGQALPGALWTYTRGPDRPDGSCGLGNGYDEVFAEDLEWFEDHDMGGAIASTMNDDVDQDTEVDFVWNTEDAPRWSTKRPSRVDEGDLSLPMIALHEFGHGLGFDHADEVVAVMNSSYPNGGDLGGGYHPHADDHAGLIANRPHSSSGTNLLLGKFVEDPADPGDAIELWEDATDAWTVCRARVDPSNGPEAIYATLHDTVGDEIRPAVVWNLSSDKHCFDGLEYEVGRDEPVMRSEGPTVVQPDVYDFGAVPEGEYLLCAMIDADRAFSEVLEGDNVVRSQARVTVVSCP